MFRARARDHVHADGLTVICQRTAEHWPEHDDLQLISNGASTHLTASIPTTQPKLASLVRVTRWSQMLNGAEQRQRTHAWPLARRTIVCMHRGNAASTSRREHFRMTTTCSALACMLNIPTWSCAAQALMRRATISSELCWTRRIMCPTSDVSQQNKRFQSHHRSNASPCTCFIIEKACA